MPFLQI
ncbi:b3c7a4f3-9157-4b80-8e78-8c175487fe25 [Thermothielavioides terrestris]|nr:b3c7a4f3-9157-4b80-8e78-8c175487fe25 [Thermothielavioides terrestris]